MVLVVAVVDQVNGLDLAEAGGVAVVPLVDLVQVEAGSGLLSLYGDQPAALLLPTLEDYFANLAMTLVHQRP